MSNKLELTWYGKEKQVKIEPRLLIEDASFSNTTSCADTENMLIHGDNLLALKALEVKYTGKVKCVYIDPPYNTGSAFEHYDDNLEHSTWLSLMRPRLELLKKLLCEDGSIWISIDDDEGHYLKVLCDGIFGRHNFVNTIVWEKKYSPQNDAKWFSDSHDFILVYAKNKETWRPNLLPRTEEMDARYKNPDNDPRGNWKSADLTARDPLEYGQYKIVGPNGKIFEAGNNRHWSYTEENYQKLLEDNRIWFGKDGNNKPSLKIFLSEVKTGIISKTIWFRNETDDNQAAKKEALTLNSDDPFATPKPERLIERVLTLATSPGDLVLDSFLGSGTTAAVAHKMARRWIGIEMGDHAYTHCKTRLDKVVAGTDLGGITKASGWTGGGGYKFYELSPPLIVENDGIETINPLYDDQMLARAVAMYEGYDYSPDANIFWKQSRGSENSYLFVTAKFVTVEFVNTIHNAMKSDEYLVIACKSYDAQASTACQNITIKKLPQMLTER